MASSPGAPEDHQSLAELLSYGVVAGHDDLMGLGDCLNLMEQAAKSSPSEQRLDTLKSLEQIINRIILAESPDLEADWDSIRSLMPQLLPTEQDGTRPVHRPTGRASPQEPVAPPARQVQDQAVPESIEETAAADEMLDAELLADFIEEARENLSSIELNILSLEHDPDDKDAINAVFRPFHSIKGVSGFLNLQDINRLSHQVENLLDAARSDALPVTDRLIDVVLQATDILNKLLDQIEDTADPSRIVTSGSSAVRSFLDQLQHFDSDQPAPQEPAPEPSVATPSPPTQAMPADAGMEPELDETIDPELLGDFIEEARENLSSIELNILALETNPEDTNAINAVFRPFHSIKGVSGFLNLREINHLSHQVENLLDAARSGTLAVSDGLIDIVLKATDILQDLLSQLEQAPDPRTVARGGSVDVAAFLQQVNEFDQSGQAPLVSSTKKIGEILVARQVVTKTVMEQAAAKGRQEKRKIGEVLVSEKTAPVKDVSGALRQQRHARENVAFVRVATDKLDNLVDGVGELVIAQSMVLQNERLQTVKDQKLQKDVVQLSRITAELQRISMSMRMVPIKNTFQKLIRLVRDLSKKAGKEIILELHGEETEIDRNMVEEIYEPLVHMIRNAADHGIESPEERERAGKSRCGIIRLVAEQSAGSIIIDIQDDGKGLDVDRIRQRALEREIISTNDNLPDSTIFDLIFHPGFSTKEKVTDVSGRGVGMDVVRKTIERLKGKIETTSALGKGSHFQIKLPLTMAIIDGMVIKVGEQRYVVPTIAMRESLRPSRDDYFTVQGTGEMMKVRESLMPLVRLHKVFKVEPRQRDPWNALLLVVMEGDRSFCLLADEIVGRQEVVIKGLGASMKDLVGISGGAILGDGRVALILDVKGIVNLHEESTD